MREGMGKYRGKTLEDGRWVYGYYVYWPEMESHCIVNEECVGLNIGIIVNPETVGEFTGRKDEDGVELYDGDVCVQGADYPFFSDGDHNYNGLIEWFNSDSCWYLSMYPISDRVRGLVCGGALYDYPLLKKIGNRHDNPELLDQADRPANIEKETWTNSRDFFSQRFQGKK